MSLFLLKALLLLIPKSYGGLICPKKEVDQAIKLLTELKFKKCADSDKLKETSQILQVLNGEVSCPREKVSSALEKINSLRVNIVLDTKSEDCERWIDDMTLDLKSIFKKTK